jgi:hypothetical protein
MILWQVVLNLTKISEYTVILTGKAMDQERLLQEALETKNDNIRLVLSCYRLLRCFHFRRVRHCLGSESKSRTAAGET